ncbi:hypothetical protein QZH41_010150 [Actinostola sp. cb2023]|nr:hypothetical protein QZH41_010150 [Actinostola sp. cb2023]
MVKQERGDDVIVVLIGNKVDQIEKRQISYHTASDFAENYGYTYIETSAHSGYNVRLLFTKLSKDLLIRHYSKYKVMNEEVKLEDGTDKVVFDRATERNNVIRNKCNC